MQHQTIAKALLLTRPLASNPSFPQKLQAFSLVELSIVLVILGLLTGGILAGQSLIRAAELRAVTTEYHRWVAATQTFRDKYMGLPGDITNGTRFWNRQVNVATCITNSSATVTTPGTCDGNGNGRLEWSTAATNGITGELFQYWRQLSLAGLIEGNYSGLNAGDADTTSIGENVPGSKLGLAGWTATYGSAVGGGTFFTGPDYTRNTFIFGAQQANDITSVQALRADEAWNIDTKLDDGKPASGTIIARYWNNACAAADDGTHASNDLAASYKVSDSSLQCTLFFRNVY